MDMTKQQYDALVYAHNSLDQDARFAEKNGEPETAQEIDGYLAVLHDMINSAQIVEAGISARIAENVEMDA